MATATFAPTLKPIVLSGSDSMNPSFNGIDFYATSSTGSTGSLTASETGWTNAPYNQSLTVKAATGCSTIGTASYAAGTVTGQVVVSPQAGSCTVAASDGAKQSTSFSMYYTRFAATGAAQSIVVPTGVTTATFTLAGAAGAESSGYVGGGLGGQTIATVPLTPGETLDLMVGQQSGFNGGGASGGGFPNSGGNGGGASDVREGGTALSNRILVAGGGGGSGGGHYPNAPGAGGGSSAGGGSGTTGGGGATQSIGGTGGPSDYVYSGAGGAGASGLGGAGGAAGSQYGGGSSGGGYYGGGGGGGGIGNAKYFAPQAGGGGGGGSSYAEGTATNVTLNSGATSGDGWILITW